MEIQIVASEFSLTPSLRERIERRLALAFNHLRGRVQRIVIRLRDLNGPRGGADKLCQVSVTMPGKPQVEIREVQEDMYLAIDGAVKRAAYRAMRLVMRKRENKGNPLLSNAPGEREN